MRASPTSPEQDRGAEWARGGSFGKGGGRKTGGGGWRRLFGATGVAAAVLVLLIIASGPADAVQWVAGPACGATPSGCCCPPLRRTRTVTVTHTAGAGLVARDADRADIARGAVRRDECPRCPPSATILAAAPPGEDAAACCPLLPAETVTETRTIVATTRVRLAANNVAPTVTVVRTVTATVTAPCPAFDPIVACPCLTSTRSATATTTSSTKWTTSSSRSRTQSATSKTTSPTRTATPATSTRSNTNSLTKTGTRTSSSISATTARVGTYCATPNALIPELGTVSSDIVVPSGIGLVSDVDVQVFWNHTYPSDVSGSLTRVADGRNVSLFSYLSNCGVFHSYSTRFDDSAPEPFTCEHAGAAQPVEPLSSFRGLAASGTWRLTLIDSASRDEGTLASWCIFFGLASASTSATRSTPTAPAGSKTNSATKTSSRTLSSTSATTTRLGTFCATPNVQIDPYLGTTTDITVPSEMGRISDVDVQLWWSHNMPSVVYGRLTRVVDGTSVNLLYGTSDCWVYHSYSTRFDDSAPGPFTCDPVATARPAGSLSAFLGLQAGGSWQLWLGGGVGNAFGTLNSWCIYFGIAHSTSSRTGTASPTRTRTPTSTPPAKSTSRSGTSTTSTRSITNSLPKTRTRPASLTSATTTRLGTYCATPNALIPDPGNMTSDIAVPPGVGLISDVDVQLSWNHIFPYDVTGSLTRVADGRNISLFRNPTNCFYGDHSYSTRFDDSAPGPFTCESVGAVAARPEEALAAFRGLPAGGTWRLSLRDLWAVYQGTFSSWCLYFELVSGTTSRTGSTSSTQTRTSTATAKVTSSRTRTKSATRTTTATPQPPFSIIRRFNSTAWDPSAMTLGDDGMIYGTLSQVGVDPSTPSGLIFRMGPSGGSYEHLAQFNRFLEGHLSLRWSKAGLVNAGNGVFFGRTLFRYTTYPDMGGNLYRFSAADRSIGPVQWLPGFDGTYPPLVYARSGDLFGVSAGYSSGQQGFVFRCSEAGTFSNLGFSLNSEALSPGNPIWIVQGCPGDDNLYGLTESDYNTLLFRLTQSGEFSVLYSFYDDDSSFWPSIESGIVPGPDCALYGTAMMQERVEPYTGKLVVWKYDIGSNQVSVVATITDYESSAGVEAQLTVGWDGALYGVSYAGGAHDGGYLFRVTTAGSYTTLHNFRAEEAWEPRVALMQGPNGVLYGAAARYMADVSYNNGTVLRQEVEWGAIFSYNLSLAGYLPS